MAKNLLDQILTISGLRIPDEHARQEGSKGLSGVEKYLRKQAGEEEVAVPELTGVAKYLALRNEEESVAEEANATGVERYLARHGMATKGKVTLRAKASGVDKYLARHGQTEKVSLLEKASGVDKYLAKHAQAAKAKITDLAKASGVDKYLAGQSVAAVKKAISPKPQSKPVKKQISKPSSTVNLSVNATQCQAATTKRTQCKRDTGLTTLERTIDKKKYRFAVCNQHKNQSFKPFSGLI